MKVRLKKGCSYLAYADNSKDIVVGKGGLNPKEFEVTPELYQVIKNFVEPVPEKVVVVKKKREKEVDITEE